MIWNNFNLTVQMHVYFRYFIIFEARIHFIKMRSIYCLAHIFSRSSTYVLAQQRSCYKYYDRTSAKGCSSFHLPLCRYLLEIRIPVYKAVLELIFKADSRRTHCTVAYELDRMSEGSIWQCVHGRLTILWSRIIWRFDKKHKWARPLPVEGMTISTVGLEWRSKSSIL